jgi:hypothetical protein
MGNDGTIHVAFYRFNYYSYYSTLYHARSDDGGETWSLNVVDSGRVPVRHSLALDPVDNNKIYLTWVSDFKSPTGSNIYTARSLDGGINWQSKVLVTGGNMPWAYGTYHSLLVDPSGKVHLVTLQGRLPDFVSAYFISEDEGMSWQLSDQLPQDFEVIGIYSFGSELIITGGYNDSQAFISSLDWGASFTEPVVVPGITGYLSNLAADGAGTYHVWGAAAWYQDKSYVRSTDGGNSWSSPDYIGRGAFNKIVWSSAGDILLFGDIYLDNNYYPGFISHYLPYSVDAPSYLALWEKASFNYNFTVLGSGQVQVSLPAADIELDPHPVITIGNQQIIGDVTSLEDRLIVTFPIDVADWISCRVPFKTKKGTYHKWQKITEQITALKQSVDTAFIAGDGETIQHLTSDLEMHQIDVDSPEGEFVVNILDGDSVVASDKTAILIYDKTTSVYVHVKANPPEIEGAKLLLLSDDEIFLDRGEPFNLEIKVTHLTAGQQAQVSLDGLFEVVDVSETSKVGSHKSIFNLFYPVGFTADHDTIGVNVTVDGVTNTVPVSVSLN